jgi:predicted RNA-binding protein with PIN domain
VFGSRPDGWWNDRPAAARRFSQHVAEWCRTHGDHVTIVFDAPVSPDTLELAGGNLEIVEARRRGRDAADDQIVEILDSELAAEASPGDIVVVTSDRGLRRRLPGAVEPMGAGRFLATIGA